jgi:hypothetical protein
MTAPPLPESGELLAHHLRLHGCDDADVMRRVCPCRSAWAGVYSRCGVTLFLATTTWCEHAAAVWRALHAEHDNTEGGWR